MNIKIEKPSYLGLSNISTLFPIKDGLLASRISKIALLAIAIAGAYIVKIVIKKFMSYLPDQRKFFGKTAAEIKKEFLALPLGPSKEGLKKKDLADWVLKDVALASRFPQADEINSFWSEVFNFNIGIIVMLPNFIETHKYWPPKGSGIKLDNMEIVMLGSPIAIYKYEHGEFSIVKRIFQISSNNVKKTVTHFHLENWPLPSVDRERILAEMIGIFYKCYDQEFLNSKYPQQSPRPFLVHGGTIEGRIGTFFTTFFKYIDSIAQNPKHTIYSLASRLQQFETASIDNLEDYELIYKTLDRLLPNRKDLT